MKTFKQVEDEFQKEFENDPSYVELQQKHGDLIEQFQKLSIKQQFFVLNKLDNNFPNKLFDYFYMDGENKL